MVELVTVGTTVGATVLATLGQTVCNALIDTGATRSFLVKSITSNYCYQD